MKFLKITFFSILAIAAIIFGIIFSQNEKLPEGTNTKKGDYLAAQMLLALNQPAWDSTAFATWTFPGGHDYVWAKKQELVSVKWGENTVLLNLKDWQKGKAFVGGKEQKGNELDVLRGKAYAYFCNDSFWLIAPYKVFDEGVTRKIVVNENGKEDLLVSYSAGGITPGDSYLWQLSEKYVPKSFKMWVKIIPIGGISATWENWVKTKSGAIIAQNHHLGPINQVMGNVQTGNSLEEIGIKEDIFVAVR